MLYMFTKPLPQWNLTYPKQPCLIRNNPSFWISILKFRGDTYPLELPVFFSRSRWLSMQPWLRVKATGAMRSPCWRNIQHQMLPVLVLASAHARRVAGWQWWENWDFMKMKISNWIGKNAWITIYIYIYVYGFGLEMWCFFVYLLKKGPTQFQIEKKTPWRVQREFS